MRVSLKWLADYVDVTLPPKELAHRLTMAGLEVEHVERVGGDWDPQLVVVGEVLSVAPHPNADRLRLATVAYGRGTQTVVCGAPNVAAGQKIAFAREGAKLIDGHSGKLTELKPAKIRGVESAGTVCSEKELGLSEEHEGILVLSADAPVGVPLALYLGDAILHIDLKPNRPDCLSMVGVAREVSALTGVAAAREPGHTYVEGDEPAAQRVAVEIADPDLCSRYVASIIEGVKIGESPAWMQERLIAGGMRPISNVVDITNYVMLELGQPLHAFDYDTIGGKKIVVRRAREGETLRTIDGVERPLTADTLVIADAQVPVAIAGVMGGFDSEVTEQTKTILLESANFHPVSIRRTATRLKSRTEASTRFEKGISAELALLASRRATKLLVELAGGRALHGFVDAYPRPAQEVRIDLRRSRLQQVLGVDLPTSQVRQALSSLGFACRWEPPAHYHVRVPYWRTDVHIEDDLAEEVARFVGYEQIPTKGLGGDIPPTEPQPLRDLRERLREALAAAGMQEVISYSLTTLEALRLVMAPEEMATYPPLKVVYPVSAEHEYLRPVLRASLLQTLAANARQHDGEIALFEAARVYQPLPDGGCEEREHIVGVVSGRREDRWGHASHEAVDLYDAKGYVEAALTAAGIDIDWQAATEFGLLAGRTAELRLGDRKAGSLGQVHPSVAAAFDIDQDVYLFELRVDELLPHVRDMRTYEAPSRFPPVVQDVALLVDRSVTAAQLRAAIEQHTLVARARLFDVYEGDRVPANKKSLAFSITYQSNEETLTDDDVAAAQRSILERLRKELGAELRG